MAVFTPSAARMLHLYQSNRLEHLASMMAAVQAAAPLSRPAAAEEIVVQSQGMRRYISRFLAQTHGIAANLRFSLPAGLGWRLMRESLPQLPELSPFDTEVMRWRLLDTFADGYFAEHAPAAAAALKPYLDNGAYAAYQLAGQIADVFDQYLVYRPDWIESWQAGSLKDGLGDDQIWQAELWRLLDGQGVPHRVALWRQLTEWLAQPQPQLPERYSVFGIAALAPVQLDLLIRLSQHRDVHIFALNPSAQYWGKVIEPAAILARGGEADLSEQGHPLLAALGKQGRDFFDTLAATETATDIDVFDPEPSSGSLLHSLQHQIQNHILPEQARADWLAQHGLDGDEAVLHHLQYHDRSIQIHSTHSPLRELHVLKDHILRWLAENPDWQPHDIAVLTPRIEPYAPFIEAVFGQQADGTQALPYSLSDVKRSRRQPLLYALEQALDTLSGRFESGTLLSLLESPPVLRRFGLSREDLPLLHDVVAQLNIRWGADAEQRAEYGSRDKLFTWQQGLERLILGWLLPEQAHLWQRLSAWHTAPEHLGVLNRFANFVRLLADTRRQWCEPAQVAAWAERIRVLTAALLDADSDDADALEELETALSDWQAQAALAGFERLLGSDTALPHIRRFLGGQSEAGFLRGGITFCGMVPMRSLPFKAVCLIGLNDGEFPRHTKAAPFDLIARHPRQGDRARRDDDRYLFLEALLSAREILYLSFVGRHIRTDEALSPSVLLDELGDTVSALTGLPPALLSSRWRTQHPLQAFSPRYFDGGDLFSGRRDYAEALNADGGTAGDFFRQPVTDTDTGGAVGQHEFIRFWRNPVRSYLQRRLNWRQPYADAAWDDSEPFAPDEGTPLETAYLEARLHHRDFSELAEELAARSLLPAGELGRCTAGDYAARAAALDGVLLHSPPLPDRDGVIDTVSGSLNYHLRGRRQHGQTVLARRSRPSSADQVALLLQHLIHCAVEEDGAADEQRHTRYIGLSGIVSLPPLPQQEAREALAQWLAAYRQGQDAPLPFFPRVSLRAAAALYTGKAPSWDRALEAAAKTYHGGYQDFAQADYPEVKLVFGRNPDAEPPYRSEAFRRLTENLFAPLAGCLAVWYGDGA